MAQSLQAAHLAGMARVPFAMPAVAGFLQLVDACALDYAAGVRPVPRSLLETARAAAPIMARSSLFSSNCSSILQALPRAEDWRQVQRNAWLALAGSASMAPELLREEAICRALTAAFGFLGPRVLDLADYSCYQHMLDLLAKPLRLRFDGNWHSERLGNHLLGWGWTDRQTPCGFRAVHLTDAADFVGTRLRDSTKPPALRR